MARRGKVRPVAPHPYGRLGWMLIGIGALCALGGTVSALTEPSPLVVMQLGFGALMLGAGVRLRRLVSAVQLVNQAYDQAQRGQSEEANRLLATVENHGANRMLRRAMAVQRARRAFDRGDLAEAAQHVDAGLAVPVGWTGRARASMVRAELMSARAVLRAARGDAAGARDDAAAVRTVALAATDALANAALADVLALRLEGKRDEVRESLHAHRRLLLEFVRPSFRAITRAVWQSTHLGVSPYRSAPVNGPVRFREIVRAVLGPDRRDDMIVDDAFVPPLTTNATPAPPIETSVRGDRAGALGPRRRFRIPVLVLWVLLVVAFLVLWQLLEPSGPRTMDRSVVRSPESTGLATGLTFAGIFVAFLGFFLGMQHRGVRRLFAATRAAALGRENDARGTLAQLSRSRFPVMAAQADLLLSELDLRAGHFEDALAGCERGIAHLSSWASRRAAYDVLLPRLHASRAVLLAILDHRSESAKEIELLERAYPAYYNLASSVHRARLMLAVRRQDFAAAAEIDAARGPELEVSYRDEMLGELAQVLARGAPRDHVRRLHSEIMEMPELGTWLAEVAPATLALMPQHGSP